MLASGGLDVNWGDVPTWVGSVLTGVALLIAAFTYRKSVRDGQRDQAKNITVWVTDEQPGKGPIRQFTRSKLTFRVKNGSDAAIYAVTLYYRDEDRKASKFFSPYYDSNLVQIGSVSSLGPGEEREATFERYKPSNPQIPWLYFRDANGVDWIRDYRARLKRRHYWMMRYFSEYSYLEQSRLGSFVRKAVISSGLLVWGIYNSLHSWMHRAKEDTGAAAQVDGPAPTSQSQDSAEATSPTSNDGPAASDTTSD